MKGLEARGVGFCGTAGSGLGPATAPSSGRLVLGRLRQSSLRAGKSRCFSTCSRTGAGGPATAAGG